LLSKVIATREVIGTGDRDRDGIAAFRTLRVDDDVRCGVLFDVNLVLSFFATPSAFETESVALRHGMLLAQLAQRTAPLKKVLDRIFGPETRNTPGAET
jgi:hypothetical protein